MKYCLDIQLFASASDLGSAVVGHRMWLGTKLVPEINSPILGVRSTPDLGSSQNTVEANTISSIREENVLGLFPSTDIEYTFLFSPTTVEQQLEYVGKEVWVYEERQNMTSEPKKFGWGVVYKVKLGGLTATGQSPEGLQECTQSGTLTSEEIYVAFPKYTSGDTPTWTYKGLQTGRTVTDLEDISALQQ